MNVNDISAGQVFKNYGELCLALDIKPKKGKGKDYQIIDIRRFIDYDKLNEKSNRLVVKEIFSESKPKVDGRGKSEGSRNNNAEYMEVIELLLLDVLARSEDKRIVRTRSQILAEIKMINQNFSQCKYIKPRLSKYTNIELSVINDFYDRSNDNFRRTIKRALKSLQDRRCISFKDVYVVKRSGEDRHCVADEGEEEFIIECEEKVIEEMGFSKLSSIFASNRAEEYYRKSNKLVSRSELFEIEFHYKALEITLNKNGINKIKDKLTDILLSEDERKQKGKTLNEKIITKFLIGAEKRHEKAVVESKHAFGEWDKYNFRSSENYVNDYQALLMKLIHKDAKLIAYEVKNIKVKPDFSKGEISKKDANLVESLAQEI